MAYIHCVFFTLKPGTPTAAVDALIGDGRELLANVPTVRKLDTGRRDPNARREVNEKDYEVGLTVCFDDRAGHDVYATHPLHNQYIERNKQHWAKVRVFDFVAG
jgi:hypothetical protein